VSLCTGQAEYPALSFKKFLIALNHLRISIWVFLKIVPYNWREGIIAAGTMENFESFSFPVNADACSAMGANQIALIAHINKPVYSGFFIRKSFVKLLVRHRANRSFRFISHFLPILLPLNFLKGV
jgi:hypothetical protein